MNDPLGKYGVRFLGGFPPEVRIIVHNRPLPYVRAQMFTGERDGDVLLTLDGRFHIEAEQGEAEKWLPFIAHCMAVSAGYSCFGENSVKDPNPFNVQIIGIDPTPPDRAEGEK